MSLPLLSTVVCFATPSTDILWSNYRPTCSNFEAALAGNEKDKTNASEVESQSTEASAEQVEIELQELKAPARLMAHLPKCASARLKESATYLHCKVRLLSSW